jgi:hypothetical protein
MVVVYLTAYTTSTADSLRDWRPVDRGCFFENERQLQYFKVSSGRSCSIRDRIGKKYEIFDLEAGLKKSELIQFLISLKYFVSFDCPRK